MKRARSDVKIKSPLCAEESRGAEYLTLAGAVGELDYPGTQTEVTRGRLHVAEIFKARRCEKPGKGKTCGVFVGLWGVRRAQK